MPETRPFQWPGPTDRTSIVGSTGSGKTRFAAFMFSQSDFHKRPHVVLDFKGDDLLKRIPRVREISLNDELKHPGLHYVRPLPHEEEEVEKFLWKIWQRGRVGIYIDEGYMINRFSKAYAAILTQGRSLKISCITLTQRPVSCSRFVFSEATFYALFRLNDMRDALNHVCAFTPKDENWDLATPLANYSCRWYDVKRNYSAVVRPVPPDDEILNRFEDALRIRNRGV